MVGKRKLIIALAYLAGCFTIAGMVIFKQYDSLLGVAGLATGVASGVGVFMWGYAKEKEHDVARANGSKKEGE